MSVKQSKVMAMVSDGWNNRGAIFDVLIDDETGMARIVFSWGIMPGGKEEPISFHDEPAIHLKANATYGLILERPILVKSLDVLGPEGLPPQN